jgi:hypothetical protein
MIPIKSASHEAPIKAMDGFCGIGCMGINYFIRINSQEDNKVISFSRTIFDLMRNSFYQIFTILVGNSYFTRSTFILLKIK